MPQDHVPNSPNSQTGGSKILVPLLLVIAILEVAGLVYALTRHSPSELPTPTVAASTLSPTAYNERITHPDTTYNLVIDGSKLVSGPSQITVKKGQSVNVTIKSVSGEVNVELEGYGIITEASDESDGSGGFDFIANQIGSFKFYEFSDNDGGSTAGTTQSQTPDRQYLGTITVTN